MGESKQEVVLSGNSTETKHFLQINNRAPNSQPPFLVSFLKYLASLFRALTSW